jgi:hypothetical protein
MEIPLRKNRPTRYIHHTKMKQPLTDRLIPIQLETLEHVKAFVKENHYPCPQIHLTKIYDCERSSTMKRVNRLIKLGYLKKVHRGMVIPTSKKLPIA